MRSGNIFSARRRGGRRSGWQAAALLCPVLAVFDLLRGRNSKILPRKSMAKRALITGITGQDGSYLAELLLSKGYEVHGLIRRASTFNTGRLDHIYADPHDAEARLRLHYGDLSDGSALARALVALYRDNATTLTPDPLFSAFHDSHPPPAARLARLSAGGSA